MIKIQGRGCLGGAAGKTLAGNDENNDGISGKLVTALKILLLHRIQAINEPLDELRVALASIHGRPGPLSCIPLSTILASLPPFIPASLSFFFYHTAWSFYVIQRLFLLVFPQKPYVSDKG